MRRWRDLIAVLMMMAAGLAAAQSYPDKSKPIRMILPFSAGTSTDVLGRALARGMTDLGYNVVVDNRPGGEAIIGVQAAKQAAPDGYTLLLTSLSTQVINPHLMAQLPYDPAADFVPITGIAMTTLMVNMGPSTAQFKTLREFFASARANPGKYTIGTASPFTRLAAEVFQRAAGVQMLVVPHKAFGDALTGLAAGQIDMVIVDAATAGAFYKNNVRPAAATGSERASAFPNVPTLREEGLAGFDLGGWFATYFPAGTPPAMVAAMRDILVSASKSKYFTDALATFGMQPLNMSGEALVKFERGELARWGEAARAAKLVPAR